MPSDLIGEVITPEFNPEFNDYTAIGQRLFESSEGINFPSVAHFKFENEKKNHNITYIAARHSLGYGVEHPTCKAIEKEFKRQTPDCVILEAITKHEYEKIKVLASKWSPEIISESPYLFQLVEEENKTREDNEKIAIFGGEPTPESIEENISKLGYNELDIYFRDFIMYIHESCKLGSESNSIQEFLKEYSGNDHNELFEKWCNDHHYKLTLSQAKTSEATAPIKDGDFVQKMTYDIGKIRNTQIFETLKESSKTYENILIVYGASHYYEEYPMLIKEFGTPTYEHKTIIERAKIHIKSKFKYFS